LKTSHTLIFKVTIYMSQSITAQYAMLCKCNIWDPIHFILQETCQLFLNCARQRCLADKNTTTKIMHTLRGGASWKPNMCLIRDSVYYTFTHFYTNLTHANLFINKWAIVCCLYIHIYFFMFCVKESSVRGRKSANHPR
jgi:hypothetical protein